MGCIVPEGFVGIANAAEFLAMNNQEGHYFLCNDIQLTSPMGALFQNEPFRGVLNGNNKALRGLVMQGASQASFGLVRVLMGGTIKDLRIVAPQVHGKGAVGVVAGLSSGYVQNVVIEGGQVTSEKSPAGAFVGIRLGGSVTGCESSAFVTVAGETGDQFEGIGFP